MTGAQIACADNGITVMTKSNEYDAWNRLTYTVTVDAGLGALDSHHNSNNLLNQITSRDVPGHANVLGTAKAKATVSLWSPQSTAQYAATSRKGEYYRGELPLNNSTGAVWMQITNLAVLNNGSNPDIVTNTTGNAFVPKTAEVFQYDRDGNLTNDGRWTYTWDAENRLVAMTSLSSAPAGSKRKVEFAYDSKGRRIQKIVSTWNGSSYVAQSTNRFVYDGWNLIAILDPQSSILQSFTWGLDLSGSLQGAGGVGGLLAVNDVVNGAHYCAYDGNGNLTALVKATDGAVTANYEYGPFGETLRLTGAMAKSNPFRFSTKYQDDETDLLYYGYRSLNPSVGRWLSRDPIDERGGANLFNAYGNDPVNRIDVLGQNVVVVICCAAIVVGGVVFYSCTRDSCLDHLLTLYVGAERQANNQFPGDETHNNEGSPADALTHCIGSCEVARNPGPCRTALRALQTANNREGQTPPNQMDVANNNEGYDLATNPANQTSTCLALCMSRYEEGGLWTFRGGNGGIVPLPGPR